jgi:hypothetical protein
VAICAVIGGNARKPGVGRWSINLPAGVPWAAANCSDSYLFDRCGFFIDAGRKWPHQLTMDSSHYARRIRARARRLSAGAWDMQMH